MEEQNNISIRLFTESDIPFAMKLKSIVGWNQNELDLERYISCEPEGCFVGEVDGEPSGTITTTTYEDKFAWIGLVLVKPAKRRRGLAKALVNHAIDYIHNKGIETIKLDATPVGRNVYVPMGFLDEYTILRYDGFGGLAGDEPGIELIKEENLPEIFSFDEACFSASRDKVLKRMFMDYPEYAIMVRDSQGIAGYAMARGGSSTLQIGPCIAKEAFVAEKLFRGILQRLPKEPLIMDVPYINEEGRKLAEKYSFTLHGKMYRMYLGKEKYSGCPERTFGTACAGKG